MPLVVHLEGITKSYGGIPIFENLNWGIEEKARLGMVGPNGTGKTSLVEIMGGFREADLGRVHRKKNLVIGYMPQSGPQIFGETVHEVVEHAVEPLRKVERRMLELTEALRDNPNDRILLSEYGEAESFFSHHEGYALDSRIAKALADVGLEEKARSTQIRKLSGGQRARLGVAALLLATPDLLLLDEPTNHLDLDAITFLENWLEVFPGAMVAISHDRWFLNRTVNEIAELSRGQITFYNGDFEDYAEARRRRAHHEIKAFTHQQEFIAKTQDFIRKNIAGQKTKQAQSRRKMLSRMEMLDRPTHAEAIRVRFTQSELGGEYVLMCQDVAAGYEGTQVFQGLEATIRRGERWGVVGPNGTGKTTFLKLITGQLKPMRGRIHLGTKIMVGYYSQQGEELNPDSTPIAELAAIDPLASQEFLRGLLAKFLFRGDEVFSTIRYLSGGERSRISLAKLILRKANLLLLDEPTNHLDIPSREAVEESLAEYPGTMVLVSHDRYFLETLVDYILEFSETGPRIWSGNYSYYFEKTHETSKPAPKAAPRSEPIPDVPAKVELTPARLEKLVRRAESEITQLESRISELERDQQRLGELMAQPAVASDYTKLSVVIAQQNQVEKDLAYAMDEWERAHAKLLGLKG